MEQLQFKEWIWPRNPETWKQTGVREPEYTKNAASVMVFSGMGPVKRQVTGTGCFVGAGAYDTFRELLDLFGDATCGELVHPVWGSMNAYFTELEFTQEPRTDYVAYRFQFREADAKGAVPY